MNIKEFVKSISVYGFLPVFTKFAGFILVPIYVRVLSQAEYGIAELILSTVGFLTLVINLEFYGAVGRFFFDREDLEGRQKLISTGLYMTLIAAGVIAAISLLFQTQLHDMMFTKGNYLKELRLGLLWAVISAVSTYLSILPRYEKKAKLYVTYNMISITAKLLSTIIFVVVLKLGIPGILYGHIVGAVSSCVLYGVFSRKYITLTFSVREAREIAKFSLPLVPGVFIIGIYSPVMRTMVSKLYDLSTLAILAFTYRITSIMSIVGSGIRNSWRPMLFENIRKASFGVEYTRISRFAGSALLLMGIGISCLSRELVMLLGTSEYLDATKLIGLLTMGSILGNLDELRGFGFEVTKKTPYITIIVIATRGLGLLFLRYLAPQFGLLGIGLAFLLPTLVHYAVKVLYTKSVVKIKSFYLLEAILWMIAGLSIIFSWVDAHVLLRIALLVVAIAIALPWKDALRWKSKLAHMTPFSKR